MNPEATKIIGLYERHAENWDQDRSRQLFEKPWLDRFLKFVQTGDSILDIGCGSAEPIARFFVEQGYKVTGVDSSPSLIHICKRRFPTESWLVRDMRELALNTQFQGILAWDSLFHLSPEDQRKMFPIFRKHSAPRAPLLFTSGTARGEAIGEYRGEPLYHGSLDTAEYQQLLQENGFAVVSHIEEDAACQHHTIWLARLM